jgi:hypothetical protein
MLHHTPPARLAPSLLAGLALILLGAGCEHHATDQLTQAVLSGEKAVAMAGSAPFFDGKVTARVTVARGIGRGMRRGHDTLLKGNTGFDATGSLVDQDKANEQEAKDAYADYARARTNIGSPLPPVTLHLILINPGADPVTVTMVDFDSDLGNFVIDPETLTVPPGQTVEPTAMVSQLGVSADEIPVTVTLKIGKVRETHTVLVRNLLDETGKPKPASAP